MKPFSKNEIKAVLYIFLFLFIISLPNFVVSLRRARDAQRKTDIGSIQDALQRYQADFGYFPKEVDGKIAACEPVSYEEVNGVKTSVFSVCEYGLISLRDVSDLSYPAYLEIIPNDPKNGQGRTYRYFSNGSRFQIYGSLESKNEDEYDEGIVKRNILCGNKMCNFGKSSGKTPLNISIEEYEQTLIQNE